MAHAIICCAQCGQHINAVDNSGGGGSGGDNNNRQCAIILYSCGRVEHEDCYFNHHPNNIICLVCGKHSNILLLK